MTLPARAVAVLAACFLCFPLAAAEQPPASPKLPITGLAPARLVPNLCSVKYQVTTTSAECQAFFDQGLGYFYSYVWMEAARSFETATRCDPDCALAWWGLSRALEHWGRGKADAPLLKAHELQDRASHREQQLILARMQEKGLAPKVGKPEARKRLAIQTIDTMLALYDDDEEAWYYRAQLAADGQRGADQVSSVPFYKALLRINPLHPGANHELVHYYEGCQRPALGWVYAENYIKSSPGIPHPFHMQGHLATRLGRWDKTCDRSAHAIELERAYHQAAQVKPKEDEQFAHHLEILTLAFIHDGRFREAHALEQEARGYGYQLHPTWFRLHLAAREWDEALKSAEHLRKTDKVTGSYYAALVYLKKGDLARALPEVEAVRLAQENKPSDRQLEYRLWEVQGLLMCRTCAADAGLELLAQAVERSKSDYSHHAWGNGAYYMELWGLEALRIGKTDVAEEAYLEALAHDAGSVRAALGLQFLCEHQGRTEEAARYAELAHRSWRHAEAQDFDAELASLRAGDLTTKEPNLGSVPFPATNTQVP